MVGFMSPTMTKILNRQYIMLLCMRQRYNMSSAEDCAVMTGSLLLNTCTQESSGQAAKPLVLVIDEMDLLLRANPAVKDSLLGFIRGLKIMTTAVRSVIGIGAFQVLQLGDSGPTAMSPFNVVDQFVEQHFTLDELVAVLSEYASDLQVSLHPSPAQFAEDLYASTDGCVLLPQHLYREIPDLSPSHLQPPGVEYVCSPPV
jgi:hypothetical protein